MSDNLPTEAHAPSSVNHVVFNVADIEESHDFWTRIIGFTHVGSLDNNPNFRFYAGRVDGEIVSHHDLALVQSEEVTKPEGEWSMRPSRLGANHIAITWPTREAWLHQVEWLRLNDVKFHVRLDHGMTHSVYVSDPNGIGIEVLYEVPEEIWMNNIHEGLNYAARIDTPEDQPIQDNVDYKVFSS